MVLHYGTVMAYDFLDTLRVQVGAPDTLYTPNVAICLLEALTISRNIDSLNTLQNKWGIMHGRHTKGVVAFNNVPHYEERINAITTRLLESAKSVK